MAILDPKTAPGAVRDFLKTAALEIDAELARRLALDSDLPEDDPERQLAEAMRYAVLGGGKRLRPALALASARAVSVIDADAEALAVAASVELLHAYTLVHDDLPSMDDDELRRGMPTVHVKYGEAMAVLTGDALLTAAFACLSDLGPRCAAAVTALARASGHSQLLAGQALDLALESETTPTLEALERVHEKKTGALFSASCELGAIAAAAPADEIKALRDYGLYLGVAFQHADDLDDGDGLQDVAAERRTAMGRAAVDALSDLGPRGGLLADLARWVGGLDPA